MTLRHFCIAELQHGVVQHISNVWLGRGVDRQPAIFAEQVLLTRGCSSEGEEKLHWYKVWRGYAQEYEVIYLK